MTRTRHARSPRRNCRECGRRVYSWNPEPICGACVGAIEPPAESLRAFRRRVIDGPTVGPEAVRDATPAELVDEPELVLEAIVDGELGATARTVELARVELEQRRADVARRHGGGLAAGGGER
jgi:hypothetical protein